MDNSSSYIDQYTPPPATRQGPASAQSNANSSTPASQPAPKISDSRVQKSTPVSKPVQDDSKRKVDENKIKFSSAPQNPPTAPQVSSSASQVPPTSPAPASQGQSEQLEDQNIFLLLGVTDGSQEEREAFLDELQQVIWEDFLDTDVALLLTDQEMEGLKNLMGKDQPDEAVAQEEIVSYLEKLIPDLEEVMFEKALELKEDMVQERIAGMREFYTDKADKLTEIDQAESLIKQDKWASAAKVLNSITD